MYRDIGFGYKFGYIPAVLPDESQGNCRQITGLEKVLSKRSESIRLDG
jgi:hypothetical protein